MRAAQGQPFGVLLPPAQKNSGALALMGPIDEPFMETPFYGARQMTRHPRRQGHTAGRRRVRRMGLAARGRGQESRILALWCIPARCAI